MKESFEITQFEFKKVIYENDNSLIVKALHLPSQEFYIIKTSSQKGADTTDLLRNEYELSKDFFAENLISNLAMIPNGTGLAIIQKDIEAQSLKDRIKSKTISLANFFEYALKITKSVSLVHEKGIIHQDINPSNILIETNENIRLIDFGISVRLERRYAEINGINELRGTLQYIAPEQTGRMNRIIDYRSDYYSLGITFYEMLTGKVPFDSSDQMELVYAHIANSLPSDSLIPNSLEKVIEKLTQKNAEERYQSATGILADLEFLENVYKNGQDIFQIDFEAGKNDFSPKLQIPQKLYGRSQQREQLLDSFEQVCQKSYAQLCLVKGYSGVGKSVLINEIQKPITQKKGYFISGKFDQFQRNVPYMALIMAFNRLIEQIITERNESLEKWKTDILAALGQSGKVLTDLMPSLELIVGKQPEVEDLAANETQNRLLYLLGSFIEVISRKEHPVVLFIDDLQWADLATLQLLQKILQRPQDLHLLIIGAYRDNEVDDTHPLTFMLNETEKSGTLVEEIILKNLSRQNIEQILIDTLSSDAQQVESLLDLIVQKTQGNAFFVNRFLNTLYEDGFLFLDTSTKKWSWDIEKIDVQNITDNVVEFLTKQLGKLPEESIEILQLGAVIGNTFELEIVRQISGKEYFQIQDALSVAEKQQFISKNNYVYRFQHDRLQQAVYLSLDEEKKMIFHKKIAFYLLANKPEEGLFELVYHLYQAYAILDAAEKNNLLELHIEAGKKAIQSVAYTSAKIYLDRAFADLPSDAWQNHYELCCDLYENRIESEFLNGNIDFSQEIAQEMLQNLRTDIEKAQVLNTLMMQNSLLGKFKESIEMGSKTLEILGYPLPAKQDLEASTGASIGAVIQNLGSRKVADILQQADAQEPQAKLAIAIRATLAPSAYLLGDNNLWAYLITSGTAMSLEKGNVLESCTLYSSYGILCGAIFSDYHLGYEYGQLALNLSQKYENQRMKATVLFVIGTFLHSWVKPQNTIVQELEEGMQAALVSGEKYFGGILIGQSLIEFLNIGSPIDEGRLKYNVLVKLAVKIQNIPALDYLAVCQIYMNELTEENTDTILLFPDNQPKSHYIEKLLTVNPVLWAWSKFFLFKTNFICGKWEESKKYMLAAEGFVPILVGSTYEIFWICYQNLFESYLVIIGVCTQEEAAKRLEYSLAKLEKMAVLNPANFERHYHMAKAMQAWTNKNFGEAMQNFELGIEQANSSGNLQDIAIFSELAAYFYKEIGNKRLHQIYITEAYAAYKRWKIVKKVAQMEEKYPFLSLRTHKENSYYTLSSLHTQRENSYLSLSNLHTQREASSNAYSSRLDTISLNKATQSIMGEVVLERLLEKLMQIVIENAGAQRGILLLSKDNDFFIEATIDNNHVELMQSLSFEDSTTRSLLPVKIVNYVQRSQKSVVLDNAAQDMNMISSGYIELHQTKSVLCMPMVHQGKTTAILYLENNLVTGAFTEERLATLNILSSQIAIAIDNALLYANLEAKVQQRTKELDNSNKRLQVTLKEVEKQGEIITQKNEDIIASINYASRIQQAMLPFEERMADVVGENNLFILYMPRDIVSGDFYFFEKISLEYNKELVFFAVADCTGHGIPGAFMSMIGNQILHETILRNKTYHANQILEHLNKGVRQALKQDQTENNDGMDISMVVLHKNLSNNQFDLMEYSGAMNPLYYVEFAENEQQFQEIKATKRAIGGRQKESVTLFQNHEISLKNPTILYLCTDGFQDQFGGAENRKFLTKRFRELLANNAHLALNDQKQLLETTINQWVGSYHQTDDITIVGLRINV